MAAKFVAMTAAIVIMAISACVLFGESTHKRTRFLMDTYVTIQARGGKEVVQVIDRAMDRMGDIDRRFSIKDPEGEIYRFNYLGIPVTDPEIIKIIKRAVRVSEMSGGKFDVTVYPLMKIWGFYGEKRVPTKREIREALKKVGYKYLVIKDGLLVKTNKDTAIDIGGIAKLFALEEGSKILKESGIKSAIIDVGGDIYATENNADRTWTIGIRNPRGDDLIGSVDVSDMLVVSSGDYERYFERDGVRYHHLMDPLTGYPARGLSSVTVLCEDPETAAGLSAAVFVMGMEKGFELAKRLGTFEVIAVTEDQKVFCSEGIRKDAGVLKVKGFQNCGERRNDFDEEFSFSKSYQRWQSKQAEWGIIGGELRFLHQPSDRKSLVLGLAQVRI